MRAKRETKAEKASRVNRERWEMLARLHGYNELAKLSATLGERVYCRTVCLDIERVLAKDYEIRITHTEDRARPSSPSDTSHRSSSSPSGTSRP